MINMEYCRFENTYKALQECESALDDEGGVESIESYSSIYEKRYIRKLITLCKRIADAYSDEVDMLELIEAK